MRFDKFNHSIWFSNFECLILIYFTTNDVLKYYRALYIEQCFVTKDPKTKEDFISAIALIKWVLVKVDVNDMMRTVFKTDKIVIDSQVR